MGGTLGSGHETPAWILAIAWAGGVWYFFILLVQAIGLLQLYRHYSTKPQPPVSPTLKLAQVPHVTILRPVKGLEPFLYECLAATFRQDYPSKKLTIYFCISSMEDPALPVLRQLVLDFPSFDTKIFVEEEDPNLSGNDGQATNLGPNPKIRNMSRGYREAKGDIVWILDCNVWIGKGVAGRMVDKLMGFKADGTRTTPYIFVHQLPLVIDCSGGGVTEELQGLLDAQPESHQASSTTHPFVEPESKLAAISQVGGGRFEEMFMASSHAKFYTAINTVAVAPCIVGKSNMFRRSHLNGLTSGESPYSPGIDYFSENICEDHLIGDLLWRKGIPNQANGERWKKHGLLLGDIALQPMARMSVQEYIARRMRWLRVRKWTVTLATFVEPGTESLLCTAYGSIAVTTIPWFHDGLGIPQTWFAFFSVWLVNICSWMLVDSFLYQKLHSGSSIELDENTPSFAQPRNGNGRRTFWEWVLAWLGREFLALPIWTWACYGGTTVMWRGKRFRVGLDMRVKEIKSKQSTDPKEAQSTRSSSKDRQD
ncbi:hypothetical protein B0O99DRAFT_520377 [Bisporella sp. PMI_857]|nr:hypothetical protein B0O99DRAFT_520377 [Bisporella sp. PMI_857]